jgi:protein involved in temperature-dependent protein secretion
MKRLLKTLFQLVVVWDNFLTADEKMKLAGTLSAEDYFTLCKFIHTAKNIIRDME